MNHCITNQIENQLGLGVLVTLKAISAKDFPVEVAANVFIGSIGSQSDVLQLLRRIGSQKPIFLQLFRHKVNNRTTFGFEDSNIKEIQKCGQKIA